MLRTALIVTGNLLMGLGLKTLLAERFAVSATWAPAWEDVSITASSFEDIDLVFCDDASLPGLPPRFRGGRRTSIVVLRGSDDQHERYRTLNTLLPDDALIAAIAGILTRVLGKNTARNSLLSDRERAVLELLARGLINKEIADRLSISTHTVISHRKNLSAKLGIKTVSGLTVYATIHGLIRPDSVL